jgi:hypothetical protein
MSFLSNGGKFKLYTVLNALIFPTAAQPRISFERAIQQATLFGEKCGNCLLYLLVEFSCFFWLDSLRASSYIVSHRSNLVQMNFPCPLVILDIDATLKHNKTGKTRPFAQGLSGGKRCRRTPKGCLARKNAKIPQVGKVNNYQKCVRLYL